MSSKLSSTTAIVSFEDPVSVRHLQVHEITSSPIRAVGFPSSCMRLFDYAMYPSMKYLINLVLKKWDFVCDLNLPALLSGFPVNLASW